MSLISSGIDKIRAFELPAGIRNDGSCAGMPRIALVKWRSSWSDKLYQIYVNGRYAGTTVETGQREMIVKLPISLVTAVRIEVFAVEANQWDIDFSDELDSTLNNGTVTITMLRSQSLPADAKVQIFSNGGAGEIDYDNPLSDLIPVWPVWQDKAGLGMSRFGLSDFGYDSVAAVGFGKGYFGQCEFGLDNDSFNWESAPLGTGVYKFGIKVTDRFGNESSSTESSDITVTPAATPASELDISSFDKDTNQLVLSIT